MTYPYTFTVNGVDLSARVQKYSYETAYTPVYSETITTMDKIDHAVIVRWRHSLSLIINPMEDEDLSALQTALEGSLVASVTFTSLQLGVDVTCNMKVDVASAALVLKNASRRVVGGIPLTFTEM